MRIVNDLIICLIRFVHFSSTLTIAFFSNIFNAVQFAFITEIDLLVLLNGIHIQFSKLTFVYSVLQTLNDHVNLSECPFFFSTFFHT